MPASDEVKIHAGAVLCGPLFYAATVVFGSPILPAASNQNTKVNMRKSYFLQALLFLGLAVSSCKTSEKVVYLQDVKSAGREA